MGRVKAVFISIFSVLLLAGMLWLGGILSEGVRNGIVLCLTTVIPSLFLFTVLTNWMGSTRILTWLGKGVSLVGRPVLGLGSAGCGVLLFSLLGGYPVGAALLAGLVRQGQMDPKQASKMLCFCSWSSPAFLIQGVGGQVLGRFRRDHPLVEPVAAALLWRRCCGEGSGIPYPHPSNPMQATFFLPSEQFGNFRRHLRHGDLLQRIIPPLDLLPLSPLWDWTARGLAEVTNGCFRLPEGVSGLNLLPSWFFCRLWGNLRLLPKCPAGGRHRNFPKMVSPPGFPLVFCAGFCALLPLAAPTGGGMLRQLYRTGGRPPFRRHSFGQRVDGGTGNLFVVKRRKT